MILRRFNRLLTLVRQANNGHTLFDKWLAVRLVLHATLDPRRKRTLRWLRNSINSTANDGQVKLTLNRFERPLIFLMREDNGADFNIGSEMILEEYKFCGDERFDLIIDGGANIGMFSIQAAISHPEASIIAYEPNPENLPQLWLNLRANQVNIDVRESALWSEDTRLYFSKGTSMSGAVSSARQVPSDFEVVAERPKVRDCTWLKLDVEGAEHCILPDMLKDESLPCRIDMEIHEHHLKGRQLCQLLTSTGYTVTGDIELSNPCIFIVAKRKSGEQRRI